MIQLLLLAGIIGLAFMSKPISIRIRLSEIAKHYEPICTKYIIKSVYDIHKITSSIQYEEDVVDTTKTPSRTLKEGKGDCEDIALLAYSLARCSGFKSGIAIMYNDDDEEAHAVSYAIVGNKFYIFSVNDLFEAENLEEASNMLGYSKYIKIGD